MELKNRFGEYIANLRKEKQISLEQLSDGLCAISMLSRFERGEREPDKLLQNRFLTRLGVVPENYENFLDYDDYCRWEKRQGILYYILEENMEEAKKLLEAYREEYKMNEALEQQFYLAMLAQIRRYEGAKPEELAEIFEKALELTVPDINTRSFRNRVLSLEELNLLLEYRYCKGRNVSLKFFEALLEYIERMEQTVLAKAKIYPKAVYYYYETWKASPANPVSVGHLLSLCDNAIEILRDANRMFYLWELFCMREELVQRLPDAGKREAESEQRYEDCLCWRKTLEELYQEYKITLPMYEYCYLYVESENYCIGDVIRIRRKMLGLSQEKFCKGICDSRTVSRLERHLRKSQKEIVQQLFERLNLSTELCRTELVTDNQEAIEKYRELRVLNNNRDFGKVQEALNELRQLLQLNISSNRQVLIRKEITNLFNCSKISKDEYIRRMKEALNCTVSYERVASSEELYLTNEEISCIQNITLELEQESEDMKKCISILIRICKKSRYAINYLRMYEYIMATVSSYYGDSKKYMESNMIKRTLIKLLLVNRRIRGLHEAIYGLLWNDEKQKKVTRKYKAEQLNRCVLISSLCNDYDRKTIYKNKQ